MLGDGRDLAARQILEQQVAGMAARQVGRFELDGAGHRDAALAQRLNRARDRAVGIDAVGIDQRGDERFGHHQLPLQVQWPLPQPSSGCSASWRSDQASMCLRQAVPASSARSSAVMRASQSSSEA